MMRAVLLSVVCFVSLIGPGLAAPDPAGAETPDRVAEIDARTEAISKTLRCVVCQNQSIHDSDAPLAADMRALVRKRVLAGDSDAAVRDYLRERYGDYVLMRPPWQLNTVFAWLAPGVLVLFALGWFVRRSRRAAGDVREPERLSEADQARVRAALEEGEA